MPKTQSERRRLRGLTVNLFSTNTLLGWSVIRQVPAREALEKIALKQWREVWYENGELAGVQPLKAEQHKTLGDALTGRLSGVTITLNEMQRNAGLFGPSRTIGMPEWKRLMRHARFDDKRILPPEDATERAIEKVRLWPYPASVLGRDEDGKPIFGDRAIRVYPKAPQPAARGERRESRLGASRRNDHGESFAGCVCLRPAHAKTEGSGHLVEAPRRADRQARCAVAGSRGQDLEN